ncbi:MAG: CidA/LrgA family protein, partial [Zoogloea sp.]|nr:CidA/LrgA family protein [Zoogloea sp.]
PVPGPVIGMALLLFCLVSPAGPDHPAAQHRRAACCSTSRLLFVPAGTGVMLPAGRLVDEAWPIAIALIASTVLGPPGGRADPALAGRRPREAGQ